MTSIASSPRSKVRNRWRHAAAGLLLLVLAQPAQAATAVGARGWDHGAYGRLVFDLAAGITGQARVEGETLVITFSQPVSVDARAALAKLPRYATTATLSEDGRTLRVGLKQAVSLKPETYQGKLVLDMRPAPVASPATPAPPPAPTSPAPAVPPPVAAARPEPARPAPAAPATPAPAPPAAAHPSPAPAVVSPPPAPAVAPSVAPPGPVTATAPAAPPAEPAPMAGVRMREALGGLEVEVVFPSPAGAVVFTRGDTVWVVFDRPGFSKAGLALSSLGQVQPLNMPGVSGFRLVGRRAAPQVTADGSRWRLLFGPDARPPAFALTPAVAPDGQGNRQLAIKVAGARQPLTLVDAEIGDTITAIPIATAGMGIPALTRLPDLDLLASTQGIAYVPRADGLETRVDAERVAIVAPRGGLTLSDAPPPPTGPATRGRPAQGVLNVATWDVPGKIGEVRASLTHEVAAVPPPARAAARSRLGRYMVTKGLGAEALGVAKLLLASDPSLPDDPAFRLMRGIALAMQERPVEALADLKLPTLEFVPDAALWRAYAMAASGDLAPAHREFAVGSSAMGNYAPHIADRLLAAMGDAALAAGDVSEAGRIANQFQAEASTAAGRAQALALAGRVAWRKADGAAAKALFEAALATGQRAVRVDAEMGLIDLALADGTMGRPEAIDRLDRLRYAWRGDWREMAVLRRLADLQLAEGRWRDGLETLRRALKLFPDDPGRDALAETQAAAFRRLFLQGAADALPPVQAVALYFDFRDLTPNGADGDEMIRRLADRLIQVELLDQAKTLLTHQVTYRLQGIARAQVAASLALLHLSDHEAARALSVLDATEQPMLPEATAHLRRLLRASALADLGRAGEARQLLAGDNSEDALRLGAEIAWTARDWPVAAQELARLLGTAKPPASGVLAPEQERLVLRLTIARALSGDAEGLKALAATWGGAMTQGKSAEAFTMLTGTADLSTIDTRTLAQAMASAGSDTGFMDTLRQRLAVGQLNPVN